jgi:hypothetical protein
MLELEKRSIGKLYHDISSVLIGRFSVYEYSARGHKATEHENTTPKRIRIDIVFFESCFCYKHNAYFIYSVYGTKRVIREKKNKSEGVDV